VDFRSVINSFVAEKNACQSFVYRPAFFAGRFHLGIACLRSQSQRGVFAALSASLLLFAQNASSGFVVRCLLRLNISCAVCERFLQGSREERELMC
jgi:hypothetical protein